MPNPLFPEASPLLDARIFAILPQAMNQLISPSMNASVSAEIPALFAALSTQFPSAPPNVLQGLHAGLWLLADDLDAAHTLCQDIPDRYGSAWHAIMHRREPDFSNANYWWRSASGVAWSVGGSFTMGHAVSQLTASSALPRLSTWGKSQAGRYDPASFVDLVADLHGNPDPAVTSLLIDLQRLEWAVLFLECFARLDAK